MLIVLMIVMIGLILLGIYIGVKYDDNDAIGMCSVGLIIVCALVTITCAVMIPIALIEVTEASVIDEKIAMYEEENQRIEASITAVVENYQQYETDIFKDVSESHSESSMILVTMYPELKSDTLVQEQITIYTANNEKIKQLKEERINASVWRWWLYFGH